MITMLHVLNLLIYYWHLYPCIFCNVQHMLYHIFTPHLQLISEFWLKNKNFNNTWRWTTYFINPHLTIPLTNNGRNIHSNPSSSYWHLQKLTLNMCFIKWLIHYELDLLVRASWLVICLYNTTILLSCDPTKRQWVLIS